jgi:integrase/recombinase XerC
VQYSKAPVIDAPPAWLQTFLDRLAADDLSAATRRGYRYDLLHFIAWYTGLNNAPLELAQLTEHDLIAWRQHMLTRGGLKATSINRRLEAVRHLLRWAEASGAVARNVALHVKSVRVLRERQPLGLAAAEVHGLLRAAGASSHGLARRNYALVQLMLQTGLRIGEVAALRRSDIVLRDRVGTVRVRSGKGLKEREVPLNATARRALRQLVEQEPVAPSETAVFRSGRNTAMPVRSMQNVIAALVRRAGLTKSDITAHSLRHTFALAWLRQHPGQLVELAQLLGHESLDTTAVYTRASAADLARGIEQTPFNLDG